MQQSFNFQNLIIGDIWNPPYERAWRDGAEKFFSDHFLFFFGISFVYVPLVFGLKAWMKNRPAYDVKKKRVNLDLLFKKDACWLESNHITKLRTYS